MLAVFFCIHSLYDTVTACLDEFCFNAASRSWWYTHQNHFVPFCFLLFFCSFFLFAVLGWTVKLMISCDVTWWFEYLCWFWCFWSLLLEFCASSTITTTKETYFNHQTYREAKIRPIVIMPNLKYSLLYLSVAGFFLLLSWIQYFCWIFSTKLIIVVCKESIFSLALCCSFGYRANQNDRKHQTRQKAEKKNYA